MFCDYVPPPPKVTRERLHSGNTYVLGGWSVSYRGRVSTLDSWAVAMEFVADGGHLSEGHLNAH